MTTENMIRKLMDDYNVAGMSVALIRDGEIVEKKKLKLPKKLVNIIHCKNPRCITSIEQGLNHIFYLADEEKELYRCQYCDEKYHSHSKE